MPTKPEVYERLFSPPPRKPLRSAPSAATVCEPQSFIETVNHIRLDGSLKAFEKKRAVAKVVLEDLGKRGRLIRTQDNQLYFFDRQSKVLEPLETEEFRAALYEQFGLNSTEEEARFVEREIRTAAMRRGEHADVHRLAWWNEPAAKLYVSANNGTLFLLDGTTIKTADNGTDGVLFLNDRRAGPLEADLTWGSQAQNSNERDALIEHFNTMFQGLSLAAPANAPDAKSQALALLKVWVLGLFFLEALPVRPIVALVGEQGSGKTTLGRRVGLVLYGTGFDVGSFRSDVTGEQDFLAAVTARRLVVFDNADARIKWLPDHLAKLATGGDIERRQLYTTNTLMSFKPECFLLLTSRDPKWKRDDVARRLLPIRMETIRTEKIPERKLQREILVNRNLIWGALLSLLNGVVRSLSTDTRTFTSAHRLADFH